MIDIKTYIKRNNMIEESYVVVDDIEEAESLAKRVCYGENLHIKFKTYSLKNIFMNEVEIHSPGISFINCNSNKDKFFENIKNSSYGIVFNNVEKCYDEDILDYIKNNKGIYIC